MHLGGTSEQGNRPAIALVASVNNDDATKVAHFAALRAAERLSASGFQVIECFDKEATAAEIYLRLLSESSAGHEPKVAFVVGHGTEPEGAILGFDKEPMIDSRTGDFFGKGIIVLNSCLIGGSLPTSFVRHPSVQACVGYSPVLRLIPSHRTGMTGMLQDMFLPSPASGQILDDFTDCLLAPLDALLSGSTTEQAVVAAQNRWSNTALKYEKFRAVPFNVNRKCLRQWGDGSAKLDMSRLRQQRA